MHELGERLARSLHGGEVILLSGPLGAGKTTLAQGLGEGLGIQEPIVSPTFTIARELDGTLADGTPAHLIHVDAYRLGSNDYAPGQAQADLLLDELESLGLDEELEEPGTRTIILMEWGEQMAVALADERLEIRIQRPTDHVSAPIGRNEPTQMVNASSPSPQWEHDSPWRNQPTPKPDDADGQRIRYKNRTLTQHTKQATRDT